MRLAKLLGVKSDTEGSLNTRAQALGVAEVENARGVELGLDKGGTVKVRLDTDLKGDVGSGGLGVVDGLEHKTSAQDATDYKESIADLGTSLNVRVDLVVVRRAESAQLLQSVNGDTMRKVESKLI